MTVRELCAKAESAESVKALSEAFDLAKREGVALHTINDSQRRSIATTLALLDEALCLFEEYGRGREVHSVCYQERNRLTARQRKRLLAEIERLRGDIRQIKEDLDLPCRIEEVGKKIWGYSAGFWEMLAEMESKRLRAYGEVSADLAEYLDPRVERLLDLMQGLSAIAGGSNDEP